MHYNISSKKYSVLPLNGKGEVKPLNVGKSDHTLQNEFGIYVLDELQTFQNMSSVLMPERPKLSNCMDSQYAGIGTMRDIKVPPVWKITKELLAYLDTLMYVCCFYKVDDSRVNDKIDDQYKRNLKRHDGCTIDGFHDYLANKMSVWLTRFPHPHDEDYEDPLTAPVKQQDLQGEE